MKRRTAGNIIFIGATASRRGGAKTAAFASAKAAQRSLAESLARSPFVQFVFGDERPAGDPRIQIDPDDPRSLRSWHHSFRQGGRSHPPQSAQTLPLHA
jgi:hypothetical protein